MHSHINNSRKRTSSKQQIIVKRAKFVGLPQFHE